MCFIFGVEYSSYHSTSRGLHYQHNYRQPFFFPQFPKKNIYLFIFFFDCVAPKMKAETSESVCSTTSCDIPEDCALQRHLCQKLRPCIGLPEEQLFPLTFIRLHELDFMVRVHFETLCSSKSP